MGKACAVYCVDENKLFHMLAEISIASLRRNYGNGDYDVVVLTNDPNCEVRGADKTVQIGEVLDGFDFKRSMIAGKRCCKLFGIMTYAKMILPFVNELKGYDRVVAIDPDIIVNNGRISEMFEDGFLGNLFIAVREIYWERCVMNMRSKIEVSNICGRPEWNVRLADTEGMKRGYCNTGLFAFDMEGVSERIGKYEECIRFASHHLANVGFTLADQDWLNYMFTFTAKPSEYMWFYNAIDKEPPETSKKAVLHFVTRAGKKAMIHYHESHLR